MINQKNILVTGANKGIGYEICRQLGAAGHRIFLTGRNEARGRKAAEMLKSRNIQVEFIVMDVGQSDSIKAAFDLLKQKNVQLDVLVNNAAVLLDEGKNILDFDPEASLHTLTVNSLGPLWVSQAFSRLMSRGGRIINISSGAGQFCGGVSAYAPLYGISKTSLNAITLHLHRDLEPKGISVNAMCPGWVRTDMGGSGASRDVAKGAETAVWLAVDAPVSLSGKFLRDKEEISW
ncbi:MAG: SDR family NAD(P)-dependent oxidoreductase [Bacteroidia bacterium]|nr:SDR family NAD(P)-dependent oxidoreductase [Bacteroidia bacterium]